MSDSLSQSYSFSPVWVSVTTTSPYPFRPMCWVFKIKDAIPGHKPSSKNYLVVENDGMELQLGMWRWYFIVLRRKREGRREPISSENDHLLSIYSEPSSLACIILLNSTNSPARSVFISIGDQDLAVVTLLIPTES